MNMIDDDASDDYEDFLPNQVIETMTCENDWDCTFGLYCNGEFCLCPRDCKYIETIESCDCGEKIKETPTLPIIIGVVCGFFIVVGWSLVIGVLIRSHVKKKRDHFMDQENQLDSLQNHYTQKPQSFLIPTISIPSTSNGRVEAQNHSSDAEQNNSTHSPRRSSSINCHAPHCPHSHCTNSRSHRSHSRSPTPQRYNKPHTSHSLSPTPQRTINTNKSNSRSPTPQRHIEPETTCQNNQKSFDSRNTKHQPLINRRYSLNPKSPNQNIDQCAFTPRRHSLHPNITNSKKSNIGSFSKSQTSNQEVPNHTSNHRRKSSSHKYPKSKQNHVTQILKNDIQEISQLPSAEFSPGQELTGNQSSEQLPYDLHPVVEIPVASETSTSNINNTISPSAPMILLTPQGLHNPPYPTSPIANYEHTSDQIYTLSQAPLPPNTPPPPYCEENSPSESNIF
ncbi:unnamed protein product [Meganyctiphanes norvegica]|uniref:EB domain-containing protein n=1 Tax=Meganyctiphanes norvegica TaxID=48144 RepID=A0AAV2Q0Q7_MEGNR